jgi:hypothetical protein
VSNNLFPMRAPYRLRWLLILLIGAGLFAMPSRPASAAPNAPVVLTPANGSFINTPTPTVTGTSDPLVTITVVIDGGALPSITSDGAGNWSLAAPALADGAHTVYAFATDLVPENSPNSNTNTFTVDTTEPTTTITVAPPAVTSSATATFEFTGDGTGSAVSGFECSLDGPTFTACSSPFATGTLAEGPHSFAVRAVDVAGNVESTPATHSWTIDTTAPPAPVVTAPVNGALVNTAQPAISGTGEPNSTITVLIDGISAGTTTASAAGSWSLTPSTPLSQGPHAVRAHAKDAAGNTGPDSATNNFTVDSVAPAAPVVTAPANGALVNTTQPPISGTGEPNSTITVLIDGVSAGTTTATAAGTWSFALSTPLSQGAHTVRARAADAAGKVSPNSATNNFTVDTVAPTADIIDVTPDPRATPVASITINFSESVTGFGLEDLAFTRNGATVALTGASLSGGPASYTLGGLASLTAADGSYMLTVLAAGVQDALGHPLAANAADQWVVDATPPDTTITSSPPAATNSGNASFAFTGNDGTGVGVASFQCSLDGDSFSTCTSPANFSGLDDGPHTFAVRAIDVRGNVDPTPASFAWTIDSSPLRVTIEQAAGQSDPTGLAPVRFTVVFNKPVVNFTGADVALSGTAPGALSAAVSSSGTSYTVRVSGMTGNGTIVASIPAGAVTDASGNGNAASTSVDNSVTFEPTTPVVTGIVPMDPNPSGAASVRFNVTFSQSVVGVDAGDFTLEATGVTGATIASVSGGGAIYNVTVNTGTGEGSVGLNLVDNDSISGFSTGVALGGNGAGNGDFTGQSYTFDRTLPAAALQPVQQVAQDAPSHTFSVTYSDSMAISWASLGDGDLRVTGPRGYSQLVKLVSTTPASSGPEIVAIYTVEAPGGSWEGSDNGAYQIALVAGEVRDTAGNSVPEGVIGSFSVSLEARIYLPLIRR